jgi:hypothetical protein
VAECARIAARKVAHIIGVREAQSAQVRADLEAKHAVKGGISKTPTFKPLTLADLKAARAARRACGVLMSHTLEHL